MAAKNKVEKLHNWIEKQPPKLKLRGVVIAPFVDSESIIDTSEVTVVQGDEAKDLLGGLSQVSAWMGDD
jgi:hypothetical protein